MRQPFGALLIMISMGLSVKRRMIGAAVGSAALAACGGGTAPAGNAESSEDPAPEAMQTQLEALPEAQRNGVFMRAIRDSRLDCQHVERSERAGEYQGLAMWRAYCERDTSFTIVITRSGVAQVMADSELRLNHEAPPRESGRGQ